MSHNSQESLQDVSQELDNGSLLTRSPPKSDHKPYVVINGDFRKRQEQANK